MTPFTNQEISPAAKEALEAQAKYMQDISQRMFAGLQKVGELNLQLAQNMMQASIQNVQGVLTAPTTTEAAAATAATLQPITGATQQYTKGLQEIAANLQVDLQSVTEQHLPSTKQAVTTLAQEVKARGEKQAQKVQETFQQVTSAAANAASSPTTPSTSPSSSASGSTPSSASTTTTGATNKSHA